MEMARKIQIPALFPSDTGAGPNPISKSIIPLLWQRRIHRFNFSLLKTANKKTLELKEVTLLQVRIGDLERPERFGALNEPSVDIAMSVVSSSLYRA